MSTTIKLDVGAIRELIKNDDEFRMELGRAVIAECVRGVLSKDMGDIDRLIRNEFAAQQGALIEAVRNDASLRDNIHRMFESNIKETRDYYTGRITNMELAPKMKQAMLEAVQNAVNSAVRTQVGTVEEQVKRAIDELLQKVIARIGNVAGIVEHNWKVEALKQIQADVAATINGMLTP